MAKDPKNRVLRRLMSGVYTYEGSGEDPPDPGLQFFGLAYNWKKYTTAAGGQYAVNRTYFDLQGYVKDDLSFFPITPAIQDQGFFVGTGAVGMAVIDLITVKPITDDDLEELAAGGVTSFAVPGSIESLHGLHDIIYGSITLWEASIDIDGAHVATQKNVWGLNTATARDRIFITRIVTAPAIDCTFNIPPSAWVIAGVSAEEKDLVYIERLRRSYDHSSQRG